MRYFLGTFEYETYKTGIFKNTETLHIVEYFKSEDFPYSKDLYKAVANKHNITRYYDILCKTFGECSLKSINTDKFDIIKID